MNSLLGWNESKEIYLKTLSLADVFMCHTRRWNVIYRYGEKK